MAREAMASMGADSGELPHSGLAIGEQPMARVSVGGAEITLLGTAHVSRVSAETVRQTIGSGQYDAVAVELCANRFQNLIDPDQMAELDLIEVVRTGKAPLVAASLALAAFQQRLAEQFGIEPGADMRAAVEEARAADRPVLLIDRDLGTTLRRSYHRMPWWRRLPLFAGLAGSVISRQEITEEQVEALKEGDMLEATFSEFAESDANLYETLVDERDRYMASRLRQEAARGYERILAVVGAGHLGGIRRYLEEASDTPETIIESLDTLPPASRWLRWVPWLVVALILGGFALGFSRDTSLGWQMVLDWTLINGSFTALGAMLALAHPLTILISALAAPLTSLNPTIGAGMVAGAVEAMVRKPRVSDFSRLRQDTSALRGWWRNRVSRVLLVFVFATLGSAIATYTAGFLIAGRLV